MKAVRVKFKNLGKKYYFSVNNKERLADGDKVVVNTIRGLELGFVVGDVFNLQGIDADMELKDIVRKATNEDIKHYEQNKAMEPKIIEDTKRLSKKNNLEIKILGAEYTLDSSKLIIYFEAEGRVDFRELVKDLAEIYRTRIELRQVGSRDGAKAFGGIGPCGLIVCCQTFITEFSNVSVKMAKNQNLSLNPVKISGNCGKLLCCINYEDELYTELRKNAPEVGDIVTDEHGDAKILSVDVLNKTVKVKYLENDGFGFLKPGEFEIKERKRDRNKNKEVAKDAPGLEWVIRKATS